MRPALYLLLALALAACSAGSEGGEIERLVTITNQWTNAADAQHRFDLNAQTGDGTARGTFTGCESRPAPSGQQAVHRCAGGSFSPTRDEYAVEGTWADNEVVLHTERRAGRRTLRARVSTDNPTSLRFVEDGSGTVVVIQRGG